jgi:uncharacterized protein (TIGR02452 family)
MDVVEIAKDTLQIIERGNYVNTKGHTFDVATRVRRCLCGTTHYEPESLGLLKAKVLQEPAHPEAVEIEFKNETTLVGARTLVASWRFNRVGVLNFASALTPGGRFLAGAMSQEESIARSSALYASLVECPEFYRFHHEQDDPMYSDRMIYSPACPVFKEDNGDCLDMAYCVDILTSAAPYAGFVEPGDQEGAKRLKSIFHERGGKMLALFAQMGCDALVLGAWGCGAFCNSPYVMADMFHHYLGDGGVFANRFRHVRFSVLADAHELRNIEVLRRAFEDGL